jgi:membrane-associated protein
MLAGTLGAIVGDSSLFWIARKSAAKMQPHLDTALENPTIRIAWESLDRSPGLLIVAGGYVPGMRFAVNASMGLSHIPYRRFFPWSVLGGALWSVYTCALAYGSTTLSGFPARVAHHLLARHLWCPCRGLLRRSSPAERSEGCEADRRER